MRPILKALLWGLPLGALPVVIRYTVNEPSLFWSAFAVPGFIFGLLFAGGRASDAKNVNDLIVLVFNVACYTALAYPIIWIRTINRKAKKLSEK